MDYLTIQGTRIPSLGFGTAGLRGDVCVDSVKDALAIGYRHLDTARLYFNEAEVGRGIAESCVPRDEIFVTTKLRGPDLVGSNVGPATDESLKALGLDHIDLLLIHAPSEDVPLSETLGAMVEQVESGKVRHIGVSNFPTAMMEEAMDLASIFTDQVPYQTGRTQRGLCALASSKDFLLTAYSPLKGDLGSKAIKQIAEAHGKTTAQVALRWLIQQTNVSPIPRSGSPEHRRSNFDIFDFELTSEEMDAIHGLAKPKSPASR